MSSDWSGRSRAITVRKFVEEDSRAESPPRTSASVRSGTMKSNVRPTSGPKKSGAVTPTIVNGTELRRTRSADGVRGAAELALPVPVADDRDGAVRAAARLVVDLGERATGDNGYAERREKAAVRPETADEARLATRRQIELRERPRGGCLEQLWSSADFRPERIAPCADSGLACLGDDTVGDVHEPGRVVHRQRAKEEAVQNGEHRAVGANRQRERQQRERGHDRCCGQRADSELQVTEHAAASGA